MTTYCDTSLLVAALTSEGSSEIARDWLAAQPDGSLAISWWIDVEVASALAAKRRATELDERQRSGAMLVWSAMRTGFHMIEVGQRHYDAASRLVDAGGGLRASDALHLALVQERRWELATLDRALARAARAIGLSAPLIAPD